MLKDKTFRRMVIGTYLFVALATYLVGLRMERLNSINDTIISNQQITANVK